MTDINLPEISGHELIRGVRAEESGRDTRTRIIVCSGSLAPAFDAPLPAGYDAYLVKPIEVETLSDCLGRLGVGR